MLLKQVFVAAGSMFLVSVQMNYSVLYGNEGAMWLIDVF